jgi:hypothetical protein
MADDDDDADDDGLDGDEAMADLAELIGDFEEDMVDLRELIEEHPDPAVKSALQADVATIEEALASMRSRLTPAPQR